jgi:hypothetical protein
MSNEYSVADLIVPRSDQLNAEQLWDKPMTITVTAVKKVGGVGTQQPLVINYDGDNGRPYKPCKTMIKVMEKAWGDDIRAYVGKSMQLYCDRLVSFGDQKNIGGIRISHMTDLAGNAAKMALPLLITRGRKHTYIVERLDVVAKPDAKATLESAETMQDLVEAWSALNAAQKNALASVKDARKTAIESAAPAADDKSEETL